MTPEILKVFNNDAHIVRDPRKGYTCISYDLIKAKQYVCKMWRYEYMKKKLLFMEKVV